jgi:hypothetical protein
MPKPIVKTPITPAMMPSANINAYIAVYPYSTTARRDDDGNAWRLARPCLQPPGGSAAS